MPRFPTLAIALALFASSSTNAADAPKADEALPTAVRSKPTAAQKRCLAATRRVERQREAIAEADARTERERAARAACKTRRACESLDRALTAAEARRMRHEKQLAQFESEAARICGEARPDAEAGR